MLSIVVASAKNQVIGQSNDLPWYLPADLRHFKDITTGGTVIMGRRTHDSIIQRLGKPLPNRRSIVITREGLSLDGVVFVHSIQEAIAASESDADSFIIGGAQIYQQALPYVQRIYMTEVDADIKGDTYFPAIDKNEWEETSREPHRKDDKNPYDYSFVTLQRKS